MRELGTMFADTAKDKSGRYWLFDRKNQFIGYTYKDFDVVYPLKKIDIDVGTKKFAAHNIYVNDGQVYVASHNSLCVLDYDIGKNIFQCYANKDVESGILYKTVKCDDKIIYLPFELKRSTYIFDIKTKEFFEKNWLKPEDEHMASFQFVFEKGGKAYLPLNGTNCLICLDIEEFSYEKIWFDESVCLSAVYVADDGIWATQYNSEAIVHFAWGNCEYFELVEQAALVEGPFSQIYSTGDELVILPRRTNYIALLDRKSKNIRKIVVPENILEKRTSASLFLGCCIDGHQLTLFPWGQELVCKLDCELGILCGERMRLRIKDYYDFFAIRSIYEKNENDLNEFCELVSQIDKEEINNKVEERIGNLIYEAIGKR